MDDFDIWLTAQGFTAGDLREHQRGVLQALYRRWCDHGGVPDLQAPYPNEHAARLRDPKDFDPKTFRRTTDGMLYGRIPVPDTISVIWAKLKGHSAAKDMPLAQSVRFAKAKWTAAKARKWLADHDIHYERFEAAVAKKTKATAAHAAAEPKGLTAAKKKEMRKRTREMLEAEQGELEILTSAGALSITAADDDGEGNSSGLPQFQMTAYTGVAMDLCGWLWPVVVDLKGISVSERSRPVLLDHDRRNIVGHTDSIEITEKIKVAGMVSGTGESAKEVVSTSKNGFPWRASVGVRADEMAFIEAGKSEKANGQEFHGPVYIARKSTLGEISFVTLGADDETEAKIAARRASAAGTGGITMFEEWLKENGFEADKISEQQRVALEAAWKLTQDDPADPPAGDPNDAADGGKKPAAPAAASEATSVAEAAAAAVTAERQRATRIEAACKDLTGEPVVQLKAKALAGEVDLDTLQAKLLDILRDDRPKGFAVGTGRPDVEMSKKVLLACAYRAGGVTEKSITDEVGEEALEAADNLRGLGIQELAARAAMLEGVELPRYQSDSRQWLEAAFSTMSLPGILSNVANKLLLEGYSYVEDAWRQVCAIASVKDFKQHRRYRLTGDMKFQPVAKDGELKHADVEEQLFTQQADTHGILFSITRQDIVNDDLSAFTAIPRMLGMGAGEAIAEAVWTLLLSNPSNFFHSSHKNYASGGTTALAIDSLSQAEQLFLDQTKPNKKPLGVPPKRLLVPTALKVPAQQLMSSLKLTEGGGSSKSKVPTDNPHAGKFEVACSAYLSNAAITGNSTTAWYLLADPRVLAAIEVAFLNGIDRPTVEQSEANFNTLGIQFRGFIDFGVAMQDYRAAAMMAGA